MSKENKECKFLREANEEEELKLNSNIKNKIKHTVWECSCGNIVYRRKNFGNIMPKCRCKLDEEKAIKLYTSKPIKMEDAAIALHTSVFSLRKCFKKNNIHIWSKNELWSPNFVENYFEEIDTQEKAYFLGLLTTDGFIYRGETKQKRVGICLNEKDGYLIEEFVKTIKINKKVCSSNRKTRESKEKQIQIYSNKMVDDLAKYGVVERKSFVKSFPKDLIDKKFINSYLRGCIDGDGTIAFYKSNSKKSKYIRSIRLFSACEEFLNDIKYYLEENKIVNSCLINVQGSNRNHPLYELKIARIEDLISFINYLYSDASIFMKRKKEKCDEIMRELREHRDNLWL